MKRTVINNICRTYGSTFKVCLPLVIPSKTNRRLEAEQKVILCFARPTLDFQIKLVILVMWKFKSPKTLWPQRIPSD